MKNWDERELSRSNASTKPLRSRESRPAGQHSRAPRERARDDEGREERYEEETPDSIAKKEAQFQEYLHRLLSPLQFPPEFAQRVLTHGSHYLARRGHNAGLSFIGALNFFSYTEGGLSVVVFRPTCNVRISSSFPPIQSQSFDNG